MKNCLLEKPNTDSTVTILGTSVSRLNLSETIKKISNRIELNKKTRVCVTPVNCILWARNNIKLRKIYNSADLTTADGVPLVWASKILGKPINGRVTGLDLLPEFSKIAAQKDFTFFLLGAADGVADKLKTKLEYKYPGLNIVGTYSPPFRDKFSREENNEMLNRINKVKPNVLWVSLTAPKQDYWIYENFNELDVNVAIGVGAAFDVVAGNIDRAPLWMQNNGLEWLFRLVKEPKRLFSRYVLEAPRFIPLILKQVIEEKF